jgi:hypothetical protein
MHIENLYKAQEVLLFKRCYAMEKIHGTSAHIRFDPANNSGQVSFFSGGSSHLEFAKLFDKDKLNEILRAKFLKEVVFVYGEAYGGKLQGMRKTYGNELKFIAFEVKIGDSWLNVPKAEIFVKELGQEFVHYQEISTELESIDIERDAPSIQAKRNGITEERMREGIVLRPLIEVTMNNGARIIAKHKRAEFSETSTPREVGDEVVVLTAAKAIADEWVTEERLTHILDGNTISLDITQTGKVIKLMTEDILREAGIEVQCSKSADREIGKATALMFKKRLQNLIE